MLGLAFNQCMQYARRSDTKSWYICKARAIQARQAAVPATRDATMVVSAPVNPKQPKPYSMLLRCDPIEKGVLSDPSGEGGRFGDGSSCHDVIFGMFGL